MPDSTSPRETRLSRELRQPATSKRVVPRDAFDLALYKWQNGERVEIGAMAKELGIGRATLFRWVGSRELLLGEVIWSLFDATWQHVQAHAKGSGGDYAADASYRLMELLLTSAALRQFIEQDAEYALRILTSNSSTVQTRCVDVACKALRGLEQRDGIRFAIRTEALAYIVVRIVESCIYSDQITGRDPDIRTASDAIRILISARAEAKPATARKTPAAGKRAALKRVRKPR